MRGATSSQLWENTLRPAPDSQTLDSIFCWSCTVWHGSTYSDHEKNFLIWPLDSMLNAKNGHRAPKILNLAPFRARNDRRPTRVTFHARGVRNLGARCGNRAGVGKPYGHGTWWGWAAFASPECGKEPAIFRWARAREGIKYQSHSQATGGNVNKKN